MTEPARGYRWLLRNASLERDQSSEWVREDQIETKPVEEQKRPRGNQDYKTHHLGRGTRWAKDTR